MKLIVWDFHGVLEVGNEYAVTEVSNNVLKASGYSQRFNDDEVIALYGKKWWEYFQYLLPDEPESVWFDLQNDCFDHSVSHPEIIAKHISLTPGALEVIKSIRDYGHDQIVISNTKVDSLPIFLEAVGLLDYFLQGKAFAVDNHLDSTRTKEQVLLEYLKDKEYDEIIIIGDSPGDMKLKEVSGGVTYLYTHPGKDFRDCEADYKIHDLREILKEI